MYVRTRHHSTSRHNVFPRTTLLTERQTWKHHYRHGHYRNDIIIYTYITVTVITNVWR